MTSPYGTGVVGTYPISGNSQIDPLVWLGFKWGSGGPGTSATVSYSFPPAGAAWHTDYATYLNNEPFDGNFQPFTSTQQTAAKQALALWAEVADIKFVQVADTPANVGDIRFGNSKVVTNSSSAAWAYTPYDDDSGAVFPENGDIWFDKAYAPNLQLLAGQFGFATMLHEIGHALGLDHPFYEGYSGEPVLPSNLDTDQYTVMSYTAELSTLAYASTPQLLDILAIQYIYGANMNTRKGNDTYKYSATIQVNKTIWDAGGIDTLDLSNQTTSSIISLIEGSHSLFGKHAPSGTSSLLGIAYGATIENANGGSGHDGIFGNAAANRLVGGAGNDEVRGYEGNDTLVGGTGVDFLSGGAGNDSYEVDNFGDFVDEIPGEGIDTVKSSVAIGAFVGVENYAYTGALAWTLTADDSDNLLSGGSGIDNLDGAAGNDTLLGNGGNDVLVGGTGDDWLDGGAGNDKMKGGTGNDTYIISAAGDSVDEQGAADSDDLVRSAVTVNLALLGAGLVEHAVLLGATGIHATGNAADNSLTGNNGANKLDGGAGADTLIGGNGADIYTIDNAGDQVIETTGGSAGGIDLVNSSVSVALGANLEKLTLTGSANIDGTGNSLNNTIVGNNGANRLDGATGNDTMTGGKGNDTYVVDSILDVVNETVLNSAGGGVDTVESSVTFSLATRANIENLILTGAGNINGTGNALKNSITGNSGSNILNGGAGADTLKGAAGNDTYILDNVGDVVDEETNTDSGDEVKSTAPIAAAFAGIENYTYTGTKAWNFTATAADNKISGGSVSDALNGGAGNDTLLGNSGNDVLIGEDGDDWLDGGIGNDKMKGGAGNDTYLVNALGDSIDEEGNLDTNDLVRSSVTINLATLGAGLVENAELIGATAIHATGNASDNRLTGNSGANKLDGGAGADTLIGGNGADTYTVDDLGDQVTEAAGGAAGGIDLVLSSIDYTLGANVEKLTLTGSADIDGTGNTLNNALIGNNGANILDGGAGNDTMTGGKGDDTYIVNSAGDVVSETVLNSAGGGVDTVESSVTFTLATRTNIEHLSLTGDGNVSGTGNALNNAITGNTGANKLDGAAGNDVLDGGLGSDTLIGGLGNDLLVGGGGIDNLNGGAGLDTFDYDALSEAGDIITGFTKGVVGDVLDFSDLLDSFGDPLDAFGGGYLDFFQSGTSTLVRVDSDGGMDSVTVLATLLNANLTQADASNYILA